MSELPNALSWNRLADEMTGNIRVGLAAGEADRFVRQAFTRQTSALVGTPAW